MAVNVNTGFDDQDFLRDIRTVVLNPLAVKAASTEKKVEDLQKAIGPMFQGASSDTANKVIVFHQHNGHEAPLDLTGMFREGSDLSIQGQTGPAVKDVTAIKFVDGKVTQSSTGPQELSYDWSKIVSDNQVPLQVGTLSEGNKAAKYLFFKGARVVHTGGDIATVDVTTANTPLLASIPNKGITTPVPIKEIILTGEIDTSSLENEKLTIDLSKGGITPLVNQNFKGFFDSLGDIISNVLDPVNGKSFAFAKDTKYGGSYYTAYWYVNSGWTELKQDPALIYDDQATPVTEGVFSIKSNPKIKLDSNGQLDLDGLSAPPDPKYFHGFFETYGELTAAVPQPIRGKSFGYVKHPSGGWIGYRTPTSGSWQVFAPVGGFFLVENKTSSAVPTTVYGLYRDNKWEVDSKGLLTLKDIDTTTSVAISSAEGDPVTGSFNAIQFMNGKSYATLQGDKLFLNHPQRVITYTSEFEAGHNKRDYEGNIFYDEASRCWVGWGVPKDPSGVDKKWTRIAHPHMSDEVKDLSKRNPAKSPSVVEGIVGDSRLWDYNGFTFIDQGSDMLPDSIKEKCGGYVTTVIQDKDLEGVTIPQKRLQVLIADQEGGETYTRRYISTESPGAATYWSPWVRTSFSKKDINAHEEDPAAHKNVIKYHKVTSFTSKWADFITQAGPEGSVSPGAGTVRGGNCGLLVDNYGYTEGTDYLEIPYDGSYKLRGDLAFSGYKGSTYPVCTWSVVLTLARKGYPSDFSLLRSFEYNHVDESKKYPPLFFFLSETNLEVGDKVYIKIKCSDSNAVLNKHPNLYFVPIKSQFVLEDKKSFSGGRIGDTYKNYLGNLNSFGNVEVKAHQPDYGSTGAVRVYGDVIEKLSKEMSPK